VRYILTCSASQRRLTGWGSSLQGIVGTGAWPTILDAALLARYLTRARLIEVTPAATGVRIRIGYQAPRGAPLTKHLEIMEAAERFLGSAGLQLMSSVVSEMSGEWATGALTPALGAGPAGVVGEVVGIVAAREVQRYLLQRGAHGWTYRNLDG
jgi:hypothetical protein